MTTPKNLSARYELGEIIGFGGMSEVHKARDLRLNRDVAIKVLRADLARDPTFYLRFKREAQNAAALNHPAIVAVYDTGEAELENGPLPYIVMEYVDGETLRDIVRNEGPLPPRRAMSVLADVCAALDFSHDAGIVHRDMKPANIMINQAGSVKVMDFGIARAIADAANPMTQTAAVIGTAQYLSPEQARGETVDNRSDVYSVGCVLFEILTGGPPFTGDSPLAVAYQHVREDPKLPSLVGHDVPRELDSIVLKAMAKNPANRYQTAGEMRTDLLRVLGGGRPVAPMVMTDEDRSTMLESGRRTPPPRRRPESGGAHHAASSGNASRRIGVVLAAGVVLLLAAAGLVWALGPGAKPDQVAIPDVVNLSASDAQHKLESLGFSVGLQEKPDGKTSSGNVIATQPLGGSRANKGSKITVQVSTGPQQVPVPRLAGMTPQQAQTQLDGIGLKLDPNPRHAPSATQDKDKIIAQDPAAGTNLPSGAAVSLTVGDGPEKVRIPDVAGQSIDVAQPNLADSAGFKINVQHIQSTKPRGEVIGTTPPAGTMADKGSTVTLQVSDSDRILMPNLAGSDPGDVINKLRAAGWQGSLASVRQITQITMDPNLVGKVVAQQPTAGSPITTSNPISISVGVAPMGAG